MFLFQGGGGGGGCDAWYQKPTTEPSGPDWGQEEARLRSLQSCLEKRKADLKKYFSYDTDDLLRAIADQKPKQIEALLKNGWIVTTTHIHIAENMNQIRVYEQWIDLNGTRYGRIGDYCHPGIFKDAFEILNLIKNAYAEQQIKRLSEMPLSEPFAIERIRIDILLEKGLDPNLKDRGGNSLLRLAIQDPYDYLLVLLLKKGAKIDEAILHEVQANTGLFKFSANRKYRLIKDAYKRQQQERLSAMKVDPPSAKDIPTNFAKPKQNRWQRFVQKIKYGRNIKYKT